jgi:hypothetical protein
LAACVAGEPAYEWTPIQKARRTKSVGMNGLASRKKI